MGTEKIHVDQLFIREHLYTTLGDRGGGGSENGRFSFPCVSKGVVGGSKKPQNILTYQYINAP